jgi:hypothetical protein
MSPAHLHHAYRGIRKRFQPFYQQFGRRHKISIKYEQEFTLGVVYAVGQGAGLKSPPVDPPHLGYIQTPTAPVVDAFSYDFPGVVVGVVQHLYFQPVRGIVQPARGVDKPGGDVALVVNG